VNEQPFKLGALMAWGKRDSERAHISFAENAGLLSKVIDEHDVAAHIANL
jgi:hypothetical protein